MQPNDSDPYHTPTANLGNEQNQRDRIQSLPRLSTWSVLGLTIITLGLYYLYWLFTRTKMINAVHKNQISMGLVHTVLGLMFLNITIAFMSGSNPENLDYVMLSNLANLAYSISNLFWVFTVRNRLHQMANANKTEGYWLHGILTFFFQVLYMQYKINEYIDTHSTETSLAS